MSSKGALTLYYFSDKTKQKIKEKGVLEYDLSLSQLIRILSVKFLLNEIELTPEDRLLLDYQGD